MINKSERLSNYLMENKKGGMSDISDNASISDKYKTSNEDAKNFTWILWITIDLNEITSKMKSKTFTAVNSI